VEALPDLAIHSDELPWVPQSDRVEFRPVRFDFTTGRWANLLRVEGGGVLNRHRHGGEVSAFVLDGSWYYRERDWVARPGTFVWEPPGDVHTLVSEEGMVTLFVIEGPIVYLNEDGSVDYEDNVFSKYERYLGYCREHGIEPRDLRF
jgi:2,4'-dihydroxyacetophenone dioxygenase